ncbi:MAG: cytochrome c [Gemmatimonadaceae bacterium]
MKTVSHWTTALSRCSRATFVALATVVASSEMRAQVKPPDPSTIKIAGTLSGAQIYAMTCVACHQLSGAGLPSQYPPLASSEFVTGDEQRLIHIVLRGLTGEVEVEGEMFKGDMPGWAPALNDAQVALVLTYVRKSFGNNAPPITAERVAAIRAASALRKKPYTAAELSKLVTPGK